MKNFWRLIFTACLLVGVFHPENTGRMEGLVCAALVCLYILAFVKVINMKTFDFYIPAGYFVPGSTMRSLIGEVNAFTNERILVSNDTVHGYKIFRLETEDETKSPMFTLLNDICSKKEQIE